MGYQIGIQAGAYNRALTVIFYKNSKLKIHTYIYSPNQNSLHSTHQITFNQHEFKSHIKN